MDQRRQDALKGYRDVRVQCHRSSARTDGRAQKMRHHEQSSQSLKNREYTRTCLPMLLTLPSSFCFEGPREGL